MNSKEEKYVEAIRVARQNAKLKDHRKDNAAPFKPVIVIVPATGDEIYFPSRKLAAQFLKDAVNNDGIERARSSLNSIAGAISLGLKVGRTVYGFEFREATIKEIKKHMENWGWVKRGVEDGQQ